MTQQVNGDTAERRMFIVERDPDPFGYLRVRETNAEELLTSGASGRVFSDTPGGDDGRRRAERYVFVKNERLHAAAPALLNAIQGLLATEDDPSDFCRWCARDVDRVCTHVDCPANIARAVIVAAT